MATSSNQLVQIPLCTFCKEEKITDWKCSDCDKPLCYECKRYHLWDYERKDHNIVRAISLESSTKKKPVLKNIFCEDHVGYYCTNYCIECRCLVCPECVSINSFHTGHTFKTIDKFHKETLEKLDYLENHIQQNLLGSVTQKLKSLKVWYNFHQKKFEEEKEKILRHADDLRKLIAEYSDKLVDELTQTLARNVNVLSQEKLKLEQFQKELKEKIKLINQSKVKDDIEQIRKDISDESTNIKHFHTPLNIPKRTKDFSVAKVSDESLISIFGSLQPYDGTADVEWKIINSYNLKCVIDQHVHDPVNYLSLVTTAIDQTILITKREYLFEMKPDKSPQMINFKADITDMLFLETNEPVFAVGNVILVKNEHDEIQTLKTLRRRNAVLALCASSAGNIMILHEVEDLFQLIFRPKKRTLSINEISRDGVLVQRIDLKERVILDEELSLIDIKGYKITENTNNNICILNLFKYNVKAFCQNGNLRWKQEVSHPIDLKSTPLGSIIVLSKSGQLVILSFDGHFIKKIEVTDNLHCSSFCFKNDEELAILNETKLHILQFSFAI